MAFDLSQLGPLASAVETAGAPILGAGLRAIVAANVASAIPIPFASLIVNPILSALADKLGGPADDPGALAQKINADPSAASAAVKQVEADHQDLLDWAQKQIDQNNAYLAANIPLWAKIFYTGWRPAVGWLGVPVFGYQLVASFPGLHPIPAETFNWFAAIWGSLAGFRTVEKWQGVAAPVEAIVAPVKRILARKSK